jgi:hypothetical protein
MTLPQWIVYACDVGLEISRSCAILIDFLSPHLKSYRSAKLPNPHRLCKHHFKSLSLVLHLNRKYHAWAELVQNQREKVLRQNLNIFLIFSRHRQKLIERRFLNLKETG